MYQYNPSPAEEALIWVIVHRESNWNPTAANKGSSARGLGQCILSTWQSFGKLAGVDLVAYPTADKAPADVQLAVILLLLREVGPNSSESWQASGPYPTFQEVQGMLKAAGIANP
jgi:hypothetical protein